MRKKKCWVLGLFFFFLSSLFTPVPFYFPGNTVETRAHENIFSQQEKEFIPVIVVLKDSAVLPETSFNGNEEEISSETLIKKLQKTARSSERIIQPVLKEEINKGNIKDCRWFWIANAFAAQINEKAFGRLSALPQVMSIQPEQQYRVSIPPNNISVQKEEDAAFFSPAANQKETGGHPWNLETINAPSAWEQGIHGKEVVVAIMDTGVDPNHSALKEHYRGNQQGHSHETSWFDATGDNSQPDKGPLDTSGHGTHIAGIILGGSPQEPLGVAPGASWIAVNIFTKGYAWDSHIIQAFQWLMAPGGDPKNAPRIVNCSWASRPEYVRDYLQWEILHNLEMAGILVVFAAGNNGTSGPGSPASYPHAFSAGALQKEGERLTIADFSSRGPVNWQGISYTKPEITAPGINIRSSWLDNGYTVLDGTSLAAAHVSGVAALLLESNPDLSPSEIKYILEQSACWDPSWDKLGKRPNNTYGFGLLDAHEALNRSAPAPRENIFEDEAEEGIMNWSTSAETPWKITRENVYEGNFSFANSPWEKYKNNSQSWLSTVKPISLQGYHSPVLSFQHFYELATGKNKEDDYAHVELSIDGKNWATIYRFSGTNEQFDHFSLPLSLPEGTDAFYIRFYLESNNNGPGKGWYLDNIAVSAVPVTPVNGNLTAPGEGTLLSGSITLQGRSQTDSLTSIFFVSEENNRIYPVSELSREGAFSIELPLGSYKLTAKREQYLTKTLDIKLGTEEEHRKVNLILFAGDINNDNRIDITDLTLLSLAYNSKPGDEHWNPLADLNVDGMINASDLALITQNYGLIGDDA